MPEAEYFLKAAGFFMLGLITLAIAVIIGIAIFVFFPWVIVLLGLAVFGVYAIIAVILAIWAAIYFTIFVGVFIYYFFTKRLEVDKTGKTYKVEKVKEAGMREKNLNTKKDKKK